MLLLRVMAGSWALFETGLVIRDRVRGLGAPGQDRGTRLLFRVTLGVTIVVAALAHSVAPGLRMPAHRWVTGAGVVVMWTGLALRAWAVVTLGRSFRLTVEVDNGQAVVTSGPYRWVRHPSYTGLLVLLVGFGLGFANWLSLIAFAALPVTAVLRRISVEEAELTRVLGEPYEVYRSGTKRLVPGVW